ncbi:MAG: HepT-like ribonuclease domain-containing protein [Patescibacteria group bacterium]
MSKHNDSVYLKHILDAANKILSLTNRGGRKLFDEDFAIADAVVRELLVVGEAARNISLSVRNLLRNSIISEIKKQ